MQTQIVPGNIGSMGTGIGMGLGIGRGSIGSSFGTNLNSFSYN